MKRRLWTAEEDEVLKELYATSETKVLAEKLDRRIGMVYHRAFVLGIYKDESYRKEVNFNLGKRLGDAGLGHRFERGHKPHNTGKKMSPEVYERAAATMFKKGQVAKNKLPVGTISVRNDNRTGNSYFYIKYSEVKWMELHRYLWIQCVGTVPPGHVVTFIDGDSLNCCIENLKLITMRENRIRNSGHNTLNDAYVADILSRKGRIPQQDLKRKLLEKPEILELKRTELKLKKLIKNGNSN